MRSPEGYSFQPWQNHFRLLDDGGGEERLRGGNEGKKGSKTEIEIGRKRAAERERESERERRRERESV